MKLRQLNEEPSIIDQIIDDFEVSSDDTDTAAITPRTKKPIPVSSAREPITIQGIDHNSFSQWLRSIEQVRHAIQENLNTPKVSLKNCISLYTEYNIKIDDFVILKFPVDAVVPYREYDREMKDGWTGKMTQEEYTDLMKDVNKNGVKEPGILEISANGADYTVQLGEGNHRLRIAQKLGMEYFPLSFSYRFG